MGYGKVNYRKDALKVNFFTNLIDAEAPNLLLPDPLTGQPLQLNFSTQTYDFEVGDAFRAGTRHVFSFGGNVAPQQLRHHHRAGCREPHRARRLRAGRDLLRQVPPRRSAAASTSSATSTIRCSRRGWRRSSSRRTTTRPRLVQPRVPLAVGDQQLPRHRDRATRSICSRALGALAQPFPLVVKAVGSRLPIGTTPQAELNEESLTAYEVAYTGTFGGRTTLGAAFYVNDRDDNINFVQLPNNLDPYTAANPPPGWPLPPAVLDAPRAARHLPAAHGVHLPEPRPGAREGGRAVARPARSTTTWSAFANYSWQAEPTVLDDDNPFPSQELALPPTNRFNVGFNCRHRAAARQRLGELLGQGVLDRRAVRARTTASPTPTRW